MKNFLKRTLTGIIYAALIIGAVLGGGWWFVAIFGIFTVLAANEFGTICNASTGGENITTRILDSVGALVLFTGLCCVNLGLLTPRATAVLGGTFFTLYLLYLIIRLVLQLYSNEPSPLANLAYSYMGQLYIALPLGIMSMYYTLPDGTSLLMAMFIMIWAQRHRSFPCRLAIRSPQALSPYISGKDVGRYHRRYPVRDPVGRSVEDLLRPILLLGIHAVPLLNGSCRSHLRHMGRPCGIAHQANPRSQGFRYHPAWPRRHPRPYRFTPARDPRITCISHQRSSLPLIQSAVTDC